MYLHLERSGSHSASISYWAWSLILCCHSLCRALRVFSAKGSLGIGASRHVDAASLMDLPTSYWLKWLLRLSFNIRHVQIIDILFILCFSRITSSRVCHCLLVILSKVIAYSLELALVDHADLPLCLLDQPDVLSMGTTGASNDLRHIRVIIGVGV